VASVVRVGPIHRAMAGVVLVWIVTRTIRGLMSTIEILVFIVAIVRLVIVDSVRTFLSYVSLPRLHYIL